ncbi:MAG TPA: type I pullulanase [Microscillaceae bacterium]|nr:type I pullulanase [Microscillaceae bacterium]
MKYTYHFFAVLLIYLYSPTSTAQNNQSIPVYKGNDLGLTYSPQKTILKLWSPNADKVLIRLYDQGLGGKAVLVEQMQKGQNGVWVWHQQKNLAGKYYTFQVYFDGQPLDETPGVYAKAVGANGRRAMILDLKSTNPKGWENDQRPTLRNFNDIIIYELHVRDFTIHKSSGVANRGKFLGLAETSTKGPQGIKTGLSHIKELGVTHVHLLPAFDYRSIDETKLDAKPYPYNWGYDPLNYNVPEGSYATNPHNGAVRIKEFKKMVQAFHHQGLRVVLDVVYNHTGHTQKSYFNLEYPKYYYRLNKDGAFSNASACGNETASEKYMMRKYILESVKYWVQEYHLDGFRFDLMGIHDIETMNLVSKELRKIDPTIFVYGEGWTAGGSPLPSDQQALKRNAYKLDKVAVFSDDIRDGIKGSWNKHEDRGFASGKSGLEESVKFGIVAATQHPQVKYETVNYSKAPYAKEPFQTINYVSCHDNHTLWDKLMISVKKTEPGISEKELINMHLLANTIVLTSQGVAFLHAGVDFLRTKNGVENSFESPDEINQIDWNRKHQYLNVFRFYQQLIQLRKRHPAFRMTSSEQIRKHLKFLDTDTPNVVAYQLSKNANGDAWKDIVVIFNGNRTTQLLNFPLLSKGEWKVALSGQTIDLQGKIRPNDAEIHLAGSSAMILFRK